jgi:hypothetical protein
MSMDYSDRDIEVIVGCVQGMVDVINKSLQLTQTSKVIKTKVSRLNLAKQRLGELKALVNEHSFIKLTSLEAVEKSIAEIENEFHAAGYFETEKTVPAKPRKSSATIGELQNIPLSTWSDGDLIVGLQFSATLQLRTPLRVLRWHGRVHTNRKKPPPKVVKEGWEGAWFPKTKTFRELGIDLPEMDEGTAASDIGSVKPSEYLPFLIGIHEIVESKSPLRVREAQLRDFLSKPEWKRFSDAHKGIEAALSRWLR